VFGVIADVTDRVLLQQELTQLKSGAGSGGAGESLFMQIIGIEPLQLGGFITTADRALHVCNEVLTAPGKDAAALRAKLDRVFRELHAVKGEAAALGLEGLSGAVHAAEEVLSGLRDRQDLSGSDFVPVVTHLDALIGRLAALTEARHKVLGFLHSSGALATAGAAPPESAADQAALAPLLQGLVREVSQASGREVQLQTNGLENVPPQHQARVKDICVQMVRNAIVHGIEAAERRVTQGKQPAGVVRVSFANHGSDDFTLLIEDDGGGLSYEQILNRALALNLVKPAQAVQMDRAAVFRLIFMPGFSTASKPSEHAGRGVGLDVVNTLVRECGGRIGIATTPGQFTRFKMQLPRVVAAQSTAA
jgi:chemotaxis protein histidine kinase CheA